MLKRQDIFLILDYLHANEQRLAPKLVGTFARTLVPKIESDPFIEISAEYLAFSTIRQAKLDT